MALRQEDENAGGISEEEARERLRESQAAYRQRIEDAKKKIRARSGRQPKTYTVQAGDTLAKIAQEVYGDASRWEEIFEANKDAIADPNVIEVGQTLKIP